MLGWTWEGVNPFRWLAYVKLLDGSWDNPVDYWTQGNYRIFSPDGGGDLMFIVGVDEAGNEITGRSNQVRPDDAPPYDNRLTAPTGNFNNNVLTLQADKAGLPSDPLEFVIYGFAENPTGTPPETWPFTADEVLKTTNFYDAGVYWECQVEFHHNWASGIYKCSTNLSKAADPLGQD